MFVTIGCKMKKVKMLHLTLQEIVDKDTNRNVFSMYWRVEQKCRKYTKIIGCYPLKLMFVASFIYSIVCISRGNRDTSTWILPYTLSVPFDTRSIFGWYCLWFIESNIGVTYAFIMITISTYFVCCCFYIGCICDHFDFLIYSLNEHVEKIRTEENFFKFRHKYRQMKDKLAQAITIHTKLFE